MANANFNNRELIRIKEEPREVSPAIESVGESFARRKEKAREEPAELEDDARQTSCASEDSIDAAGKRKRRKKRVRSEEEDPEETARAAEGNCMAAPKRKERKRSAQTGAPHAAAENVSPARKPNEKERSAIKEEEDGGNMLQTVEENTSTSFNEKKKKKKFKPINMNNAVPWHSRFVFSNEDIEELKDKYGIELKTGRFAEEEDARIRRNWDAYSAYYNVTYFDVFLNGRRNREASRFIKETNMYAELARKLTFRTVKSVFHRARVILHPHHSAEGRPFSESEKKRLKELQEVYGRKWTTISTLLERTPNSIAQCSSRAPYKRGPFTDEEKEAIFEWVRKTYTVEEVHKVPSKDIDWERMRQEVARDRYTQQLKDFWVFFTSKASLDKRSKKEISLRLLKRLGKSSAKTESEVPWSEIAAELSCDERFLRRKFSVWKCRLSPSSRGQSIAELSRQIKAKLLRSA